MYAELTTMASEHDLASYVKRTYPELKTTEDIGEEVFSTLLGLESQGKMSRQDATFWNRVKEIASEAQSIMDFMRQMVTEIFGVNVDFELDLDTSLMDIIGNLNNNIIFGDGSALKNLDSEAKSILEDAMNPIKTEEDIESRLKELGLIKRICR